MKRISLPSVIEVSTAVGMVVRRFPVAVLMASAGVVCGVATVELGMGHFEEKWLLGRIILSAVLGFPLAIAGQLFAEGRGLRAGWRGLLAAVSLAAAALYFVTLPSSWDLVPTEVYIRTAALALGLHFVVAFAPFAGRGREAAFWEFNWGLFLRFWLGVLYSDVLYVGLVAAVASASKLFDLQVEGKRYFELWIIMAGFVSTCFVLHGTPQVAGDANGVGAYPRGLGLFARFALAPLVIVYLGILYPYAAKIALRHAWPDGWVALPILCLAVAGVLAALFLHPVRERPEERWAGWYWRWFFRALLPLTVLLYLAVRVRVREYGITESRYFGFVLAGWLAVAAAYYWREGNRSIRWLPASLAFLCLLTTWGPWGGFRVSEASQLARLEAVLAARGLLPGGVLTPRPQRIDRRQFSDLKSMLIYLRLRHESIGLDRLLAPARAAGALRDVTTRGDRDFRAYRETDSILGWLGVVATATEPRMGAVSEGYLSVHIEDRPGDFGGSFQAGEVLSLNVGTPNAPLARPGWPSFQLLEATGEVVTAGREGRVRVLAVGEIVAKAPRLEVNGIFDRTVSWARASTRITIDGKTFLVVLLNARGQVVKGGRFKTDAVSLLVLEQQ